MWTISIKNKLIIISIILIFFISLTSLNATDIDNNISEENSDNLSDIGDFTELSKEINITTQKTVYLTKDYVFDSENDYKISKGIDINIDDIIIDGQNHFIDAGNNANVFNVKSDNVVLKNIRIINGYSKTHGGSVYFTGLNGTIINSTFKNCTSERYGGAVSFKSTGEVINCEFVNNSAGTGGGVDFGGNAKIISSVFKNNYAKFQGGAVSLYGLSIVENSTFMENTGGDGGTVYAESECHINNSTFIRNYAIGYGGGIYFMTNGIVNNTIFTQNTAFLEGGAIIIKSDELKVLNSQFNNNTAENGRSLYLSSKFAQLENLTFNNENTQFSSEIYLENTELSSNNLTFNNITEQSENTTPAVKAKTTIKCASKTFKARQKVKKYAVKLKSGKTLLKGKKIKLTVNKKVYYKKTNSQGKAIFKIKLNRKEKYKVKVLFNGDKLYKASQKSVKIKIK